MRAFFILCWLLIPVLGWAYHLGPGQTLVQLDRSDELIRKAASAGTMGQHEIAVTAYNEALATLPSESIETSRQIRLELAKEQMLAGQLPEARSSLEGLLDELEEDPTSKSELVDATRTALASAQFHMTWLMRLEGKSNAEWEPEIDAARQHYRLLAEQTGADERKQDLESAIRLARMDLSELQALNIPSQCKNCNSGQCKKPSAKPSKKKSENKKTGAGLGPLPDGVGA